MSTTRLTLTKDTLNTITSEIEKTEVENEWSNDKELEIQQGSFFIIVTYMVLGEHVREYNFHSEVSYDCYENISHMDFVDAEITNIEAWDKDGEQVCINNLDEVKYYD